MVGLQLTVLLGAAVLAATLLAPRLRLPTPLLMLLIGVALGFLPPLHEVHLPPEIVLMLFLPVMLFWESCLTSFRSLKRDLRGVLLMSTLLVVATALGAAGIAWRLGLPWQSALVLGAALAPPDATAIAALGKTLPQRHFMMLRAESLTNDGTALVVFAIAVGMASGQDYSPATIAGLVGLSYVGGIVVGGLLAAAAIWLLKRLEDATTINLVVLLLPFAAYLAAESVHVHEAHASGVLAVVVAGLAIAYWAPHFSNANSRIKTQAIWPVGSYVINGSLFVMVGLEMPFIAREVGLGRSGRLLVIALAVWVGLMLVRFSFQVVTAYGLRLVDRRPEQRRRRLPHRARVVSSVAGFRGGVSLAIALSVPAALRDGREFPARWDILFVTSAVIALTLLVQGPLLPRVIRWAALTEEHDEAEEIELAEDAILAAALESLDELAAGHDIDESVRERVRREFADRQELIDAARQQSAAGDGPREWTFDESYSWLRLAIIDKEREAVMRLLRDGEIDDAVAMAVQRHLDLEELRVAGAEAIE